MNTFVRSIAIGVLAVTSTLTGRSEPVVRPPAHAAAAAVQSPDGGSGPLPAGSYRLKLDRPVSEGYRSEQAGTITSRTLLKMVRKGATAESHSEYEDIKFDVIDEVIKVSKDGKPLAHKLNFRSLTARAAANEPFESLSCVGAPISVEQWPIASFHRDDGKPLSSFEEETLKHIYDKADPNTPNDDVALAVRHVVRIGDSWSPSASALQDMLIGIGAVVNKDDIVSRVRVSSLTKLNGLDCLTIDGSVRLSKFKKLGHFPLELTHPIGSFTTTFMYAAPVDLSKAVVRQTQTFSLNFSGEAVGPDGQHVVLTMQSNETKSANVVKEL